MIGAVIIGTGCLEGCFKVSLSGVMKSGTRKASCNETFQGSCLKCSLGALHRIFNHAFFLHPNPCVGLVKPTMLERHFIVLALSGEHPTVKGKFSP